MIEIKNSLKFPTWNIFKLILGFQNKLKSINYVIATDDLKTIYARIRWCYTSVENKKNFPFTEQGYVNACKCIENQRIKLIEELL